MEALYRQINARSIPVMQESLLLTSPEYCVAVWTLGHWTPTRHYASLLERLNSRNDRGIVYDISGAQGCLHWTLFQTETFPVEPVVTNDILDTGYIIKNILYQSPHIRLSFKGVSKTRFGLFLCGYSDVNINAIRDTIRSKVKSLKEPHPQDIYHSTLFRYTKCLEGKEFEDEQVWLDTIVAEYADKNLFELVPTQWQYGFGTWRQTASERKVLLSWDAHPLWILHRGLRHGPDPTLENKEFELLKCIHEGWNVELDLWSMDGRLMLGHDGPTTPLSNSLLLEDTRVWVHCKNLEAAIYCQANPKIHYFIHDTDMAVLTSKGFIWCYPGYTAGKQSICVMPERVGLHDFSDVGAVCTDYLPNVLLHEYV